MTAINEKDYQHPNERGNGPKARMEGGDETDDIWINDPGSKLLAEHNHLLDQPEEEAILTDQDFTEKTAPIDEPTTTKKLPLDAKKPS